jgi:phospholipid/cholesterol/gamma-HCH transport system substrate-binding protein
MERQANYVLVGVIGVVLLISAFVFVVWFAHFQFNQQYDKYEVHFRGPVSGLGKGAEVQLNGIKVGEITHIALDKKDANLVIADLQVESGTPVRVDSTATPVTQGITGVKFVQVSPGSPNQPLLRKVSKQHPPIIASRRSGMEDLMNDATRLTANGAEALGQVNRLLSNGNIDTLSGTLSDVQATTAELKARKSMFASMQHAMANLDRASAELQLTLVAARGTLGTKDKGMLADLAVTTGELRRTAVDMHALVDKSDGPVTELSNSTIPEMTAALDSFQKAADRLDSLAFQIQQNPKSLLTSSGAKEVEIPQ